MRPLLAAAALALGLAMLHVATVVLRNRVGVSFDLHAFITDLLSHREMYMMNYKYSRAARSCVALQCDAAAPERRPGPVAVVTVLCSVLDVPAVQVLAMQLAQRGHVLHVLSYVALDPADVPSLHALGASVTLAGHGKMRCDVDDAAHMATLVRGAAPVQAVPDSSWLFIHPRTMFTAPFDMDGDAARNGPGPASSVLFRIDGVPATAPATSPLVLSLTDAVLADEPVLAALATRAAVVCFAAVQPTELRPHRAWQSPTFLALSSTWQKLHRQSQTLHHHHHHHHGTSPPDRLRAHVDHLCGNVSFATTCRDGFSVMLSTHSARRRELLLTLIPRYAAMARVRQVLVVWHDGSVAGRDALRDVKRQLDQDVQAKPVTWLVQEVRVDMLNRID